MKGHHILEDSQLKNKPAFRKAANVDNRSTDVDNWKMDNLQETYGAPQRLHANSFIFQRESLRKT